MAYIRPAMPLLAAFALAASSSIALRPAYGQTAPVAGASASSGSAAADDGAGPGSDNLSTIVVSGTRITSSGFSAPTPTTVVNAEDLQRIAEPNVFTSISELPSLEGSTGVTTGTNSTSSGTQGLSSFSMRGLGTIRTLTLLDGQRVVGANVTGVPDISEFPQLLIKRVDVVTGGASASYGSDAVGGVVNFVTDKHFEGFKAEAQGGVTTYGDDRQFLIGSAAGGAYFDGRLHVEGSVEYDHEDGVPAGGFGEDAPDGRTWFHATTLVNTGITNNGLPQYVYANNAQSYQYGLYGLITAGPLEGTAIDAAGNPYPFVYGSNGVPGKNSAGTVSGCYIGFCVGGDNSGAVGIGSSLQSSEERLVGYSRIGWSIDDDNEIYATVNLAQVQTANQPNPGSATSGLTMSCSNPYVPSLIQDECTADGITSFKYGVDNAVLPNPYVQPKRVLERFVVGAEGEIPVAGTSWHYDTYYEHGSNVTDIQVSDMPLTSRYMQAVQAVSLDGEIACANPVARAAGCIPLDIFGDATPSAAALSYIDPANGPFQHTYQTQNAASLSIDGEPFSLWAAPVSLAFGGEYRREFYWVNADPYGNGVSAASPYSSIYPADPILSTAGDNWYAGNYHDGTGQYHVTEAFVELNLPFLDSPSFGKANLNPAVRWTDYSTSGVVYTWKLGGTWQTPYSPLRLRAVLSRDVRAPNLSELYAAPLAINFPGFTDPFNNTAITVLYNLVGNPDLKPEKANNLEVGVVFDRPEFLPGFSASVDYYRIKIDDVISTLSGQQEVDFCYAGIQQYCNTFNFAPASGAPYVNVEDFNLASIYTNGLDIEASYQVDLGKLRLPGFLTARALATHIFNYISNPGIPGTVPVQLAGVNTGSTPYWKLYGIQSWDLSHIGFDLTERWVSAGVFGQQYIVCQSDCPVSTVNNPTINYNHMAGALYFDLGARYSVTDKLTTFFKIDNLLNRDPVPSPGTNTGIDINPELYDTIGRTYRAGVRYNF